MAGALSRLLIFLGPYCAVSFPVIFCIFYPSVLQAAQAPCATLQQVDALEQYLFAHPQDAKARYTLQRLLSLPPCNQTPTATSPQPSTYRVNLTLGWDSNPAQFSDQRLVKLTTEAGTVTALNAYNPYPTLFQAIQAQGRLGPWDLTLFWRHDQEGVRDHRIVFHSRYPWLRSTGMRTHLVLGLSRELGTTGYLLGLTGAHSVSHPLLAGWRITLQRHPEESWLDGLKSQIYLQWSRFDVGQITLTGSLRQPRLARWPGGTSKTLGIEWERAATINNLPHTFILSWRYITDTNGWSPLLKNNAVRSATQWSARWQTWPGGEHEPYSLFVHWSSQHSNLDLFAWTQLQAGIQWRLK